MTRNGEFLTHRVMLDPVFPLQASTPSGENVKSIGSDFPLSTGTFAPDISNASFAFCKPAPRLLRAELPPPSIQRFLKLSFLPWHWIKRKENTAVNTKCKTKECKLLSKYLSGNWNHLSLSKLAVCPRHLGCTAGRYQLELEQCFWMQGHLPSFYD